MWLHWREKHLRAARLVAVHAVAIQTAATGEARPVQVTDQLTTDQAPPAAAAEELLTALQPAPMQVLADQPAVMRQIAPQSGGLLLAAYAALRRAWEQHWSTISEHEEGVHNQLSMRDRATESWGAKLYCQSPGVHNWQFDSRKADQLQASKVAVWEAAMADCRHAMLQLQRAKAIQHNSLATPEQAISQCHPSAALEFRLRAQGVTTAEGVVGVAGFSEAAQMEVDRRVKAASYQYRHNTGKENAMVHLWLNRGGSRTGTSGNRISGNDRGSALGSDLEPQYCIRIA